MSIVTQQGGYRRADDDDDLPFDHLAAYVMPTVLVAGALLGLHLFSTGRSGGEVFAGEETPAVGSQSIDLATSSLPPASAKAKAALERREAAQIKIESRKDRHVTHLHERMGSTFQRIRTRGSETSGIRTQFTMPEEGFLVARNSREYHFNGYVGFRDRDTGVNVEAGLSYSSTSGRYAPFMRVNSREGQSPDYLTNGSLRHSSRRVKDHRVDRWTNLDLPIDSPLSIITPGEKVVVELTRSGENSLSFVVKPASGKHARVDEGRVTLQFPAGALGKNTQFRRVVAFDGTATYSSNDSAHLPRGLSPSTIVQLGATALRDGKEEFAPLREGEVYRDINHEGAGKSVFATPISPQGGQTVLFESGR